MTIISKLSKFIKWSFSIKEHEKQKLLQKKEKAKENVRYALNNKPIIGLIETLTKLSKDETNLGNKWLHFSIYFYFSQVVFYYYRK